MSTSFQSLIKAPTTRRLRLLPSFPTEIHLEILGHCSPSTLAATCRVSFSFLQLSSPLLYREVELKNEEDLYSLFSRRPASSLASRLRQPLHHSPRLGPFLSLSQIRILTLRSPEQWTTYNDLIVARDRIASAEDGSQPRLQLDRLVIRCSRDFLVGKTTGVLALVEPCQIEFIALKKAEVPPRFGLVDAVVGPRVSRFTFVDSLWQFPAPHVLFVKQELELVYILRHANYPMEQYRRAFLGQWYGRIANELGLLLDGGRGPRKVEIRVRTEEEVSDVVLKLKGCIVSGRSVFERLGSALTVVVST